MYIKLGSTKLNYRNQGTSDFIILSEIVDSSLSYEKPVLVRTTEELDIWFGEEFTSRNYFIELLKQGITLFLYKPVSPIPNTSSPDYVNYSDFDTVEELFNTVDDALKWIEPRKPGITTLTARATTIQIPKDEIFIEEEEENLYFPTGYVDESKELLVLSTKDYNHSIFEGENGEIGINISKVPKDVYHLFYKIISEGGEYMEDGISYNLAIYQGDELVFLNEMPQNLDFVSDSINNRDSLVIYGNGDYFSPKYNSCSLDTFFQINSHPDLSEIDYNTVDYNKLSNNYQTLAFKLNFGSNFLVSGSNPNKLFQFLIVLSPYSKEYHIIVFHEKSVSEDTIKNDEVFKKIIDGRVSSDNFHFLVLGKDRKKDFCDLLLNLGYVEYLNGIYVSYTMCPVNYFYDLEDFSMIPDFNLTNDIIYSRRKDNTNYLISFVSKTIGTGSVTGNIKVSVKDLGDKTYRITISRFNYSEVFEGKLSGTNEEQRLDYLISQNSKLVMCELGSSTEYLLEGEWFLRGGQKEADTPDHYLKSLHCIFNTPDPIFFDYLLIPDIKKFTKPLNPNLNHYEEYETILNYSKLIGNQVLIQNLDNWDQVLEISSEPQVKNPNTLYKLNTQYYALIDNIWTELTDREKIAENTYLFNYTEDKDNRLLYFYRSMSVYGNNRPGYYIYLYNLFYEDKYSPSVNYIIYNSPISKDSYNEDINEIEKSLEDKKCNYLIENNHIYYYKKYQNGNNFSSSGWMRFCLGKISRELSKNKWWILSDSDVGKIKQRILSTLENITRTFSIIRNIQLSDFSISFQNQSIDLTIDTYMSDLVDNNIRIDITINYYK